MSAILQKLARHSHISTTMAYYVALSADEIGTDLWSKHGSAESQNGNILGNITQETPKGRVHKTESNPLF